jgi:subtilisin family serine protease
MGHGTHVAGTIGAVRDQRGMVGVAAERARIYMYRIFDASGEAAYTDAAVATESCVQELERLKASVNQDMKMVVSMSIGAPGMLDVWDGDFYGEQYARGVRARAG